MGRPAKPWRRKLKGKATGPWCSWVGGRQQIVAPIEATYAEAVRALAEIKADPEKAERRRAAETVEDACDAFLAHCGSRVKSGAMKAITLEHYVYHLKAFVAVADMPARDLRPHHVLAHFNARGWGQETRRAALIILRACWKWCKDEGLIGDDPLGKMRIPTPRRRREVMTNEQADRLRQAIVSARFLDIFDVLRETGCRPADARRVEAAMIDFEAMTWTLPDHKTAGHTQEPKTVYMTPRAAVICRRLAAEFPEGPIFRNEHGKPWTMHVLAGQFRRCRKRAGIGPEAVAYACRHGFITDGLSRGVPVAVMANLVGHKSTTMISRHYDRLDERTALMRATLEAIRPGCNPATTSPTSTPADDGPAPDSPAPEPPPASSPGSRRGRRR